MNAYENPMEFVQDVYEEASELARTVGETSDFFYDGGAHYQQENLECTELSIAATERLLHRLRELKEAQERYFAEKEAEIAARVAARQAAQ